jgi:exodeoxyribonuclease VIII
MMPEAVAGLPFDEYLRVEALSFSGACKLMRSPAHYLLERTRHSQGSPEMLFGTAVHDGILEPETFAERVVVAPEVNARTKAGRQDRDAFAAENAERVVLSPADYARALRVIEAVRSHPTASYFLAEGQRELSLFWRDRQFDVPCKARVDIRSRGCLVDLKSARDASPNGFGRSIATYSYHWQAWHYYSGHEHVFDASPEAFIFIAVETEEPHLVGCYELPSAAMLAGRHAMTVAAERYAACLREGRWPGYSDQIQTIRVPAWALRFDE